MGVIREKYCRNVIKPDKPDVPYAKGADIIREQLRAYFLWETILSEKKDKELWWRYMAKFDHNICLDKKDVEDCSLSTMKELGLSSSIIDKVKEKS